MRPFPCGGGPGPATGPRRLPYTAAVARSVREGWTEAVRVLGDRRLLGTSADGLLDREMHATFKRPVRRDRFTGEVQVTKVYRRKGSDGRRPLIWVDSEIRFWDTDGGHCHGTVRAAVPVHPVPSTAELLGSRTGGGRCVLPDRDRDGSGSSGLGRPPRPLVPPDTGRHHGPASLAREFWWLRRPFAVCLLTAATRTRHTRDRPWKSQRSARGNTGGCPLQPWLCWRPG